MFLRPEKNIALFWSRNYRFLVQVEDEEQTPSETRPCVEHSLGIACLNSCGAEFLLKYIYIED